MENGRKEGRVVGRRELGKKGECEKGKKRGVIRCRIGEGRTVNKKVKKMSFMTTK